QTADSRQQTADSRQQTADSRQQTADSRTNLIYENRQAETHLPKPESNTINSTPLHSTINHQPNSKSAPVMAH
ncbi:hypothetical protein E4U61_000923, partial [Claviceps capensis]